jgi:hypothetical protein
VTAFVLRMAHLDGLAPDTLASLAGTHTRFRFGGEETEALIQQAWRGEDGRVHARLEVGFAPPEPVLRGLTEGVSLAGTTAMCAMGRHKDCYGWYAERPSLERVDCPCGCHHREAA